MWEGYQWIDLNEYMGVQEEIALVDYNHAAAILSTPACCSHRIAALAWPFSQRLACATVQLKTAAQGTLQLSRREDVEWAQLPP